MDIKLPPPFNNNPHKSKIYTFCNSWLALGCMMPMIWPLVRLAARLQAPATFLAATQLLQLGYSCNCSWPTAANGHFCYCSCRCMLSNGLQFSNFTTLWLESKNFLQKKKENNQWIDCKLYHYLSLFIKILTTYAAHGHRDALSMTENVLVSFLNTSSLPAFGLNQLGFHFYPYLTLENFKK